MTTLKRKGNPNIPPMIDHRQDASPDNFYCHSCCSWHPEEYQSPDLRYCQFGYNVMHEGYTEDDVTAPHIDEIVYSKINVAVSTDKPEQPARGRGRPRKTIDIDVIETGKSQKELAEDAGVSQSTISRRRAAAQGVLPGMAVK